VPADGVGRDDTVDDFESGGPPGVPANLAALDLGISAPLVEYPVVGAGGIGGIFTLPLELGVGVADLAVAAAAVF